MNQNHLLALLQTGYTTLNVEFPPDTAASLNSRIGARRLYTYKVLTEDGVKVGDTVVVDTPRDGLKLGLVVEVHKSPQINVSATFNYKWIVQKVDTSRYDVAVQKEDEFLETMQEVERAHQRALLLEKFRNHLPEGSEARLLFDTATQKVGEQGKVL